MAARNSVHDIEARVEALPEQSALDSHADDAPPEQIHARRDARYGEDIRA